MKKIMILGAGIYQVPLIKRAKELGLYTIVVSIPGKYPGFDIADKVYYESTTNVETIYKIALQEEIDGILTTGTDVAVKTIGYVCEQMGLKGISQRSAEYTTDKAKMKKRFVEGGVKTASFHTAYTVEDAIRITKKLGLPVMFKCVDKSGSRGIIKVESEKDIVSAFEFSLSYSNCNYIVIEKFLAGYEIGIDGYVSGDQRLIVPHAKIVHFNGMTKVPIGHIFPIECSDQLYQDIMLQTNKAIDALQLDNCFFNVDAMIDGEECYIIEMGGRTGATCIPELMSIYLGCDYYEKMIYNALGEEILFDKPKGKACAGQLIRSSKTGTIVSVELPTMEHNDGELMLDFDVDDKVNAFKVGPDRIGHIIVSGETVEEAFDKLIKLDKQVKIDIAEEGLSENGN